MRKNILSGKGCIYANKSNVPGPEIYWHRMVTLLPYKTEHLWVDSLLEMVFGKKSNSQAALDLCYYTRINT